MITEIKADLFTCDKSFALAHCISEDYAMGAGIAVLFEKKFKLRKVLLPLPPRPAMLCLKSDRFIFNLVTKKKYWQKPTYDSITKSIEDMKEDAIKWNINKIAMPKIGCGLDRLQWDKVKKIIEDTFEGTGIKINVYYL